MSLAEQIDKGALPRHIAIIMDGNGRWAREQGQDRLYGHFHGVESVRNIVEGCAELGVDYLTLYAFSTENWERPEYEVVGLMELLVNTIRKEVENLNKNNIRLHVIGDMNMLPHYARKELEEALEITARNTGLNLIMALSYSGRWELLNAVKNIANEVRKGRLAVEEIDQDVLQQYLCTSGFPDPELMIRTSGEYRISNFLLYQLAYAELYFTPVRWPDFRKENLYEAILDFQRRERRFGKTSEQVGKPNGQIAAGGHMKQS
ncbi:MAG TPA: isoprenyl transferase [Chitinophagaceae bacterium]|nr:isoprenyl transferase [Chitinophagaceae bacterium]